jgi:hypothetical protein
LLCQLLLRLLQLCWCQWRRSSSRLLLLELLQLLLLL